MKFEDWWSGVCNRRNPKTETKRCNRDRIEQLEAENTQLQAEIDYYKRRDDDASSVIQGYKSKSQSLRDENARLREALEWIAADRSMTGETTEGLQRAARDALDGDK